MSASLLRIGFVGHCHLGVISAVAAAEKKMPFKKEIRCVDWLENALDDPINNIEEPELIETANRHQRCLQWGQDPQLLKDCDLVIIAWDVPTDDQGNSDLKIIGQGLETVFSVLNSKAVLVILSQVPPGFTRGLNFPIERLFYQVETLIFGEALNRALNPERIIIGQADKSQALPESYQRFLSAWDCPQWRMSYESAELSKTAINLYLASTLTVTNTLANLCESLGADWADVKPALQSDKRIGPYAYLNPGLGLAGGNLKRDLMTLTRLGAEQGKPTRVIQAALIDNQNRPNWVLQILRKGGAFQANSLKIGIWGITYKPNTPSLKDSAGIAVLKSLPKQAQITVFDPMSHHFEKKVRLLREVSFTQNPELAAKDVDWLLILSPWPQFQQVNFERVSKNMANPTQARIIDPYGVWPTEAKIWRIGLDKKLKD